MFLVPSLLNICILLNDSQCQSLPESIVEISAGLLKIFSCQERPLIDVMILCYSHEGHGCWTFSKKVEI